MDVLNITPTFFYSYQCGSTLLTSYIPVYMYAISFQIISSVTGFIISTNFHPPHWFIKSFPVIFWPSSWNNLGDLEMNHETKTIRLINPHQIISRMMNSIGLLLSFGLCSPVLSCFITLNICIHLGCWLLLIDRFVCLRLQPLPTSTSVSSGWFSILRPLALIFN